MSELKEHKDCDLTCTCYQAGRKAEREEIAGRLKDGYDALARYHSTPFRDFVEGVVREMEKE